MAIKNECKLVGWDIDDLDTDSYEASSLETHPHAMIRATMHCEECTDTAPARYQCEHCKEGLTIDDNGIIKRG